MTLFVSEEDKRNTLVDLNTVAPKFELIKELNSKILPGFVFLLLPAERSPLSSAGTFPFYPSRSL